MNGAKISLMLRSHWSVLSASADILPLLGYAVDDFVSERLSFSELIHPDGSDLSEILFWNWGGRTPRACRGGWVMHR